MSVNLALLLSAGILIACGVYLLLERTLTRVLLGFMVVSNGVNLLFLVAMGEPGSPPFYESGEIADMSDPLPQAMVLTAIVITMGLVAFVLALAYRSWQLTDADEVQDDVEDRRVAIRAANANQVEIREAARRAAQAAAEHGAGPQAELDLDDSAVDDINSDDVEMPGSMSEADEVDAEREHIVHDRHRGEGPTA